MSSEELVKKVTPEQKKKLSKVAKKIVKRYGDALKKLSKT